MHVIMWVCADHPGVQLQLQPDGTHGRLPDQHQPHLAHALQSAHERGPVQGRNHCTMHTLWHTPVHTASHTWTHCSTHLYTLHHTPVHIAVHTCTHCITHPHTAQHTHCRSQLTYGYTQYTLGPNWHIYFHTPHTLSHLAWYSACTLSHLVHLSHLTQMFAVGCGLLPVH